MFGIFWLIFLIIILYAFLCVLLQCDFEDRLVWFIICLILMPLITICSKHILIFKNMYEIYTYLSKSVLFQYRSLFILVLLSLSFSCCYKLNNIILEDDQKKYMSSRLLSFSRSFGYCGLCSILLFSPFFKYVSLHPNERIASYGFFHLYLDIFIILLLTFILDFASYFFANLYKYYTDIFNFSEGSTYKYVFRQCFWYCYSHKKLYWEIKRYLSNNLVTIRDIHIKFHVSKNIAEAIKIGKLDEFGPYNRKYRSKKGSNNVNFIIRMFHNHYIKKKTDNEIIRRAKLLINGGSLKYDDKKDSLNNKINNDAKTLASNQLYKIEHKYNSKIKN